MRVKLLLILVCVGVGAYVLKSRSPEGSTAPEVPSLQPTRLPTPGKPVPIRATPELLLKAPKKYSYRKDDPESNEEGSSPQVAEDLLVIGTITTASSTNVSSVPSGVRSIDPNVDALREVEAQNRDFADRIVPGLGAPAAPAAPAQVIRTPTPLPTPTPTGLPLVGGQARGYAMLYLMHPRARQTVERQLQILFEANIQEMYLSVLTDGTFGQDLEYLASVIRRIGRLGRSLTLALYLTNGATMRAFNSTTITAGFNQIDPLVFRDLIQQDFSTQQQFLSMTRKVAPVFDLNRRENRMNRNVAIVMLEDNLDANAYRSMRSLALSALPRTVVLVRNPCLGCYEGNDSESFGDAIESHTPNDLVRGAPMRGFSLDGVGYALPGDTPSTSLNTDEMHSLLTASVQRGLAYFALWRKERQGIAEPLLHPDQRVYEVPRDSDKAIEIDLLRFGLSPVAEVQ